MIVFKTFMDKSEAVDFQKLLSDNTIYSEISNNIPSADTTFVGNTIDHRYDVKIQSEDFSRAQDVLKQESQQIVEDIDPEHYLFQFTNDELLDILKKQDEWYMTDVILAKRILKERNYSISESEIENLNNIRKEELIKPEKNKPIWIFLGYFFAISGGLIGVIIGHVLWKNKKTLPNGEQVYNYSEKDREHGKQMFGLGILTMILMLIIRFYKAANL